MPARAGITVSILLACCVSQMAAMSPDSPLQSRKGASCAFLSWMAPLPFIVRHADKRLDGALPAARAERCLQIRQPHSDEAHLQLVHAFSFRARSSIIPRLSRQSAEKMSSGPQDSFVLRLDAESKVVVIRDFLKMEHAAQILHEVSQCCNDRLALVGSRKTTVFFENPGLDYLFSGRRFKADNVSMPAAIEQVMRAAGAATQEPFNGAVQSASFSDCAHKKNRMLCRSRM